MSDSPPPIPQKNKHKCLNTCMQLLSKGQDKMAQLISESTFEEGFMSHNILEFKSYSDFLIYIHKLDDQCLHLRGQDQKLMRIFMFIREEIQLLNESYITNKSQDNTNPSGLSLYSIIKRENESPSTEEKIESFLQTYLEKGRSEKKDIEPTKINFSSYFDVPHLSKAVDEFKYKYALSTNSIQNYENITTDDANTNIVAEDLENSLNPPPVPEKKVKRHISSNSTTFPNGPVSINNDSTNDRSLVSDPVLNQNWPRSKSFNSNAFLINHNRQSSMTLSDLYDHLNPIPNTRHQRTTSSKNTCKESFVTYPENKLSPDHNSTTSKPLKTLPMSQSNLDCKLSSLDSSNDIILIDSQDITFHESANCRNHITRSIHESVNRDNILSSSLNIHSIDSQLSRADSTPSLFSHSIFSNSSINNNQENSIENSNSLALSEHSQNHIHDKSPNTYFKSKSPKKFFSILSRGISSGFNKSIEKKTSERYSSDDLSNNLDNSVGYSISHKNNSLFTDTSPKSNRLISSILSPVIEHPPPIPPKFQKPSDNTAINLQQTWC